MQAIVEGELAGVDGYIIDLRNNPGGVFEEAIAMSSYFLDGDGAAIVETVRVNEAASRRDVIDNVWQVGSLPGGVFPRHAWGLTSRPVVLLTNHGTASASEVMAGALQACPTPATTAPLRSARSYTVSERTHPRAGQPPRRGGGRADVWQGRRAVLLPNGGRLRPQAHCAPPLLAPQSLLNFPIMSACL